MQVEIKRQQQELYQKKRTLSEKKQSNKERDYKTIQQLIKQLQITFANTYTFTIGAPIHIKQMSTDLKGEIYIETIKGNFDIPLLTMGKSSRQKSNAEMLELSLLQTKQTQHTLFNYIKRYFLKCEQNILQSTKQVRIQKNQ